MSTTNNNIPAAFIPANICDPIKTVDITTDLSSMYPIIGCTIVEPVALHRSYNATLWVDEEGFCKQNILNLRASVLCGRPIVGDAIMAGTDGKKIVPLSLNCPKILFDSVQAEAEAIYEQTLHGAFA